MPNLMTTQQAITALAPYVAQGASAAYSGVKRARTAYDSYKGSDAEWAAKKIGRAWRKASKSKYARRTQPSASQNTRQFGRVYEGPFQSIAQRNLLVDAIPFPPQDADVGYRLGSAIKVSGIKVCERFTNRNAFAVRCHYAVIQQKDRGLQPTSQVQLEFFRSTNVDTDSPETTLRAKNFVNALNSSTYEFAYDCYPINPDKFNILCHYTKVLGAKDTWAGEGPNTQLPDNPMTYTWNINKYFNLSQKQMVFTFKDDTIPENPILRVFWWQALDGEDWGTTPADETVNRLSDSCVFFKNGLN